MYKPRTCQHHDRNKIYSGRPRSLKGKRGPGTTCHCQINRALRLRGCVLRAKAAGRGRRTMTNRQSHKTRLRSTKSRFALLRNPETSANELSSCLESWGAFCVQSSGSVEHVTSLPKELSRSRRLHLRSENPCVSALLFVAWQSCKKQRQRRPMQAPAMTDTFSIQL